MPDRFRILEDSFDGEPSPSGEEYPDFNALSRLSSETPVNETQEAPLDMAPASQGAEPSPALANLLNANVASSSTLAAPNGGSVTGKSLPLSGSATSLGFNKNIESTSLRKNTFQDPAPVKSEIALAWRKMPLRDVFATLRTPATERVAGQNRLRGMFRR
ncbi:hypothetical protein HW511_13645 [Asaia siamensis]|uniref:hypothetical protein n=1 Tax=Asaia siamensis TaxID=110479 RepID=UPI00166DCA19|nr:hypothetical protein [Asaia siamensis]